MIPTLSSMTLAASLAAGPPTPPAAAVDLLSMYPGPIAATHKLRCTDGRFYVYDGDMAGCWSRSIDPGSYDYHVWTPATMYYFGWQTARDGLHWVTPPILALPRFWDPSMPYRRDSTEFIVHRRNAFDIRLETVQTFITIDAVVERGESLYRLYGLTGTESETWYLSPSLPVAGGGAAPGMRGAVFTKDGQTTAVWEFTEWVVR